MSGVAATGVQQSVLAGGLRLVTTPTPESPVAAVHLWFEAGARDEGPGEAGAAHLVEHLLFKGTERRAVGEAADEIESLGGDLNAWTSWDETCFHATLDAEAVADALDVLLDMTGASRFDPDELAREQQVVVEEIRGYQEEPDAVAADLLHERLFGDHPYGRPILGTAASVSALDRDRLVDFWRSNYHPGRAILGVAGPVNHARLAAFVDARLARWPGGRARPALAPPSLRPAGGLARCDRDFGSVLVHLGWAGPAFGHPDGPALEVALQALANGSASRLVRALDLDAGVASQIGGDHHALVAGGAITLSALSGDTLATLELARGVLDGARRDGLARSEVVRAREALLADLRFAHETTEGLGADRVYWAARTGDPEADRAWVAALAAVEPADVARVVERWLDPGRAEVVVVDHRADRRALGRAWSGERARRAPGRPAPEVAIAVAPDRGEVAAIEVVAVGGALLEQAATAGAAEAWSRLVGRGVGPWDARGLGERCDSLGVSLDASSGRSLAAVHVSFPSEELGSAVEILGELLLDPHLGEDDWDIVREELKDDLAALPDRPVQVGGEALLACLFPGHPWRLPLLGREATLDRITPTTLRNRHERTFRRENLAIGVAGGVDPERVRDALAPWLARLPAKARPPDPGAPGEVLPGRIVRAGQDQATVLAGVRGLPVSDPDRTVLAVVSALLDRQSGRMFLALREQKGLAYGVWARAESGVGAGVFSAGLSTDLARVDEARDGLLGELRRLLTDPPDAEELAKVRRMLLGLEAMRLQRVSGRAADLARSLRTGVEPGREALERRLRAVTTDRVVEVCSRVGLADPTVVTVLPVER